MKKIEKIAFFGLGVMGAAMAGHIAQKTDCELFVYNRSLEKSSNWLKKYNKGTILKTPDGAGECDAIFLCVGNDDDIREVLADDNGLIHTIQKGAVIVDHTTSSAEVSRDMASLFADKGCYYLDAPVSGGQAGAENGALTVMAGGDRAAFAHVEPLIRKCYAKEMRYMGTSGAGQLAKMVNQICIAGVLQGLSEGLAFGKHAGLDMDELLAVISKGAAQSWQMDNRAKTMVEGKFDFGFAVDLMIKDLGIALEEGRRNGTNMKMTARVLDFYREVRERGGGRWDTSSLITRLFS